VRERCKKCKSSTESYLDKTPSFLTQKPLKNVKLSGKATDPDGDALTYHWWQYEEVDTYKGKITLQNAHTANASFKMPSDAKKGETIHLIFAVTDSGKFKMTRYQRVIVKCG
jgi:hypothetical protein